MGGGGGRSFAIGGATGGGCCGTVVTFSPSWGVWRSAVKLPHRGLVRSAPEVNAFCGEKATKKLRKNAEARRPFII